MGKYVSVYEVRDLNQYCKSRCRKAIVENTLEKIGYYRGQYKGYSYGMKVTRKITKDNLLITHVRLYNIFKTAKGDLLNRYIIDGEFRRGMLDSIYDMMNYVSMMDTTKAT